MASVNRKLIYSGSLSGNLSGSEPVSIENLDVDPLLFIAATAVGAATSLVVKVQHSPDGTNWYDLVSFTALTAAGAELKVPTTAVLGRLRISAAFTGGTTTATLAVTLHSRHEK